MAQSGQSYGISIERLSSVAPEWSNSSSRVGHLVFALGQRSTIEALSNTLSLECDLRPIINFKIFLGGHAPRPLSMSCLWQLSFLRQLASNTVGSKYLCKNASAKVFLIYPPLPKSAP